MQREILFLALIAGAFSVPVKHHTVRHAEVDVDQASSRTATASVQIPCSIVPIDFCTVEAGCKIFKGVCEVDTLAPPVNCSALMTSTGAAVTAQELALLTAMASVKSTTWITMQGTQATIGKAADSFKASDSALKSYNDSLVAYQKEVDKLDVLSAAMIELMSNCSIPAPPLTCPAAILALQASIAKQNATCELKWIATSLAEQKWKLADAAVEANDALIATAMLAPAKVFSEAAAQITAAETAKSAAVAFWTTVKGACITPAPTPVLTEVPLTSRKHKSKKTIPARTPRHARLNVKH